MLSTGQARSATKKRRRKVQFRNAEIQIILVFVRSFLLSTHAVGTDYPRSWFLHIDTCSPAFVKLGCKGRGSNMASDCKRRSSVPRKTKGTLRKSHRDSKQLEPTFSASWHSLRVAYRNSDLQPKAHMHWPLSIRQPCWVSVSSQLWIHRNCSKITHKHKLSTNSFRLALLFSHLTE